MLKSCLTIFFTLTMMVVLAQPTINNLDGETVDFIEGGSAVTLDNGDADILGGPFETGDNLTVQITANGVGSEDTLTIGEIGSITVGDSVAFSGDSIGLIVYVDELTIRIDFDDDASTAAVVDLLRAIQYENTNSDNPDTTNRSIEFSLLEFGVGTETATVTVNGIAVNDEPSITAFGGGEIDVLEGDTIVLDADAILDSDPDQPADYDGGRLMALVSSGILSEDSLVIDFTPHSIWVDGTDVNIGGTTIGTLSYDVAEDSLQIFLNSNADSTDVNQLIRSLGYHNVSTNPDTATIRTISVWLDDGDGNANGGDSLSAEYTVDIHVIGVNDSTEISDLNGDLVQFFEGSDSVHIDLSRNSTLYDPDNPISGSTDELDYTDGYLAVAIAAGASSGGLEDTIYVAQGLYFNVTGGTQLERGSLTVGTISYPAIDSMVVAFSAPNNGDSVSLSDVQELLRNIVYANTNTDNPDTTSERTLNIWLDDGDDNLNGGDSISFVSTTIDVVSINDEPSVSNFGGITQDVGEQDSVALEGSGGDAVIDSDPDSPSNYEGGRLIASITSGILAEDSIGLLFSEHGFWKNGSDEVIESGNHIGDWTYDNGEDSLEIVFTANADSGVVTRLIRSLAYFSVTSNPDSAVDRTLSLWIDDGDGNANGGDSLSAVYTIDIDVYSINDSSEVSNLQNDMVTFSEGPDSVFLDLTQNASLFDPDDPIDGGTAELDYGDGSLSIYISNGNNEEDTLFLGGDNFIVTSGDIMRTGSNPVSSNTTFVLGSISYPQLDSMVIDFNASEETVDGDSTFLSDVELILQSIVYLNTNDYNPDSTGIRTITWTLDDGDGNENGGDSLTTFESYLDVLSINEEPSIANIGGTVSVTEDGTMDTFLDTDAYLIDPDSANTFPGGRLYLQIASGGVVSEDTIYFDNGSLGFDGDSLTLSSDPIADYEYNAGTDELTLTFDATVDSATITTIIRSVKYENLNTYNPDTTAEREIQFVFGDGYNTENGGDSLSATYSVFVDVIAVNEEPALLALGGAVSYIEGASGPTTLDNDVYLADPDSANSFPSAVLSVSITNPVLSEDTIFFDDGGTTTFAIDGMDSLTMDGDPVALLDYDSDEDSLSLTFDVDTDSVLIRNLLRAVVYQNTNTNNPDTTNERIVEFVFGDGALTTNGGDSLSATYTINIDVIAVNDPPSVASVDGDAVIYTEGRDSVHLDDNRDGILSDLDNPISPSGDVLDYSNGYLAVAINSGGVDAEDTLVIGGTDFVLNGSNIERSSDNHVIGQFSYPGPNPDSLYISFPAPMAGDSTLITDVQNLIRAIAYRNTNELNPDSTGVRTINWWLDDGDDNLNGGDSLESWSTTVDIEAKNDAPLVADTARLTILEDILDGSNTGLSVIDLIDPGSSFSDVVYEDRDSLSSQGYIDDLGIAVFRANDENGTWQYTTDNGSNWFAINASVSNVLMLGYSANNRVRFVPDADHNSTFGNIEERDSLWFYGWDQTYGANGTFESNISMASERGDTTAFSLDSAIFILEITPVNDEPTFTSLGDTTVYSSEGSVIFPDYVAVNLGADDENDVSSLNRQEVLDWVNVSNDSTVLFTVQPDMSNDSTLTFTLRENAHGLATVTLAVRDNGGVADGGDNTSPNGMFSIRVIDDEGPEINNFSTDVIPNDNDITVNPSPLYLQATFDEVIAEGVEGKTIRIYDASNTTTPFVTLDAGNAEVSGTDSTMRIDIDTYLPKGRSYFVRLDEGAFIDTLGNLSPSINTVGRWNFTVEDAEPVYNYINPSDTSTNVLVYEYLTLAFDEAVDSLVGATETVRISGGGYDETFTASQADILSSLPNDTVIIRFPAPFATNTTMTVEIQEGFLVDDDDNPIPDTTYTFVTATDGTEPLVSALYPANQSDFTTITTPSDVESIQDLSIDFDETIEAGDGNIRLYVDTDEGGSDADILVFDIASNNAAVNYVDDSIGIDLSTLGITLTANATYYIQMDSGAVRDLTGNPFDGFSGSTAGADASNADWSFNTEDTDGEAPDIVTLYPSDNAGNVSLTPNQLRIEFDEPVQLEGDRYIQLNLIATGDSVTSVLLDSTLTSVTLNGNNLTVDLSSPFSSLTQYYVTIEDSAVYDFSNPGNYFEGITTKSRWNFVTEFADDDNGPAVIALTPSDDETNVSVRTEFMLAFDEQLFPGEDSVYLRNAANDTVAAINVNDVDIDGNQVTVAFSPDEIDSLLYSTAYNIVFPDSAFVDGAFNPVTGYTAGTEWNFTTEDDNFRPELDSITVIATGNSLNGSALDENSFNVRLVFNESVNTSASQNGEIKLYYKDQNVPVYSYQDTIVVNTFENSDAPGATGTTYLTGLSGGPARVLMLDLTSFNLPGTGELVVDIDSGAFVDTGAPNAYLGINQSNNQYVFDVNDIGTVPTVERFGPIDDEVSNTAELTSSIYIDFSEPVNPNTALINVNFSNNAELDFTLNASDGVPTNSKTRYVYTIPENLKGSSSYYIDFPAAAFEDLGTNDIAQYDGSGIPFTTVTDANRPVIASLYPADNATNVDASTDSILITFNEPITATASSADILLFYRSDSTLFRSINVYDDSDLDGDADGLEFIELRDASNNVINYSTVTAASRLFIDLDEFGLQPGVELIVIIQANSIEDASGNGIAAFAAQTFVADNSYTFRIANDGADPTVVSTYPANAATNIAVDTDTLKIVFSEAVTPRANTDSIEVYYDDVTPGDDIVAFKYAVTDGVADSGNTMYYYELPVLAGGATNYYVLVDDGAFEDIDGNDMSTTYTETDWTFTTAAGNDAVNPTFTFTPADGATNVSVNPSTDLVLTFDEIVVPQGGQYIKFYSFETNNPVDSIELTSFVSHDTVEATGSRITYNYTFDGDQNYYVLIDDASGNGFLDLGNLTTSTIIDDKNDWSFSTASDNVVPFIDSVYFNNSADTTGIDANDTINVKVYFSEKVVSAGGTIYFQYDSLLNADTVYSILAGSYDTLNNRVPGKGSVVTYKIPNDQLEIFKGGLDYRIRFGAGAFEDLSGNVTALNTEHNFETADDGAIPEIIAFTPPDDATNVDLTTAVLVLEFDQPVDSTSTGQIVLFYKSSGEAVDTLDVSDETKLTVSESQTVYTYADPFDGMQADLEYYIHILDSSFVELVNRDAQVAAISNNSDWTFTTNSAGDIIPAMESLDPIATATGVGLRDSLFIEFSEPVFATNKNITITGGPNGNIVINALDVSQIYGNGSTTITIDPEDDLHQDSTYTVTWPLGTFVDATGNQFDAYTSMLSQWTFTTGSGAFAYNGGTGVMDTVKLGINNVFNEQNLQDTIYIIESNADDFRAGGNLIFGLTNDFSLDEGVGNISIVSNGTSTDLTLGAVEVDDDSITINFTHNGLDADIDTIVIADLRIRYDAANPNATGNIVRIGGDADIYGLSTSHETPILFLEVEDVPDPILTTNSPVSGQIRIDSVTWCYDDNYDDRFDSYTKYQTGSVNLTAVPAQTNYEYHWFTTSGNTDTLFITDNADQLVEYADFSFTMAELSPTNFRQDTTITRYVTQVNPNGTSSDTVEIEFTIKGLPNSEDLAGSDMTVCHFEEITLGKNTNPGLSNTPSSYIFDWTGVNIDTFISVVTFDTTTNLSDPTKAEFNPTIDAPQNFDTVNYNQQVFQYTLTVVDNYGCVDIDTATVDITIEPRIPTVILSPNGVTFSEAQTIRQPLYGDLDPTNGGVGVGGVPEIDSADYYLGDLSNIKTNDNTLVGYSGTFVGSGVGSIFNNSIGSHEDDYDSASFTPSGAGVGVYEILYVVTEDATGCRDTSEVSIEVLQDVGTIFEEIAYGDTADATSGAIRTGITNQYGDPYNYQASGSADRDYCIDDNDGLLFNEGVVDYYDDEFIYLTVPNVSGFDFLRYEGPGVIAIDDSIQTTTFNTDLDSIWRIDLDSIFRLPDDDNLVTLASGAKRITIDRVVGNGSTEFVDGSDEFTIYPLPTGEISNIRDYYCEDDNNYTPLLSLTNGPYSSNSVSVVEYTLTVLGNTDSTNMTEGGMQIRSVENRGNSQTFMNAGGLTLVFADILANATIGLTSNDSAMNRDEIVYRIDVSVPFDDDPFYGQSTNAPGCGITITDTITVFAKPNKPTIDFTAMSNGDTLPGTQDIYRFEYSEGETPETFIVTDSADEYGTRIRWYEDQAAGAGANSITVSNGRSVAAFTLLGSTTWPVGEYDYFFSQVSNSELSGFDGCESEVAEVEIIIHEEPDPPVLLLDANTHGDIFDDNHYVFEYCEGDSIEDITIDYISLGTKTDTTFYDWYVYDVDQDSIIIIDGWNPLDSLAEDAEFAGVIDSIANRSVTARQLFEAKYGVSTSTPVDSTYTFYVARRENRNINLEPNYNGSESEKTRIDIVVYPIPDAPSVSLFETDINAASSSPIFQNYIVNYNDRISTTQELDVPDVDTIEYVWYQNGAAFDSVRSDYNDSEYPEKVALMFQDIPNFGVLSDTLDGSTNYYTTDVTVDTAVYLRQIAYKLNRITDAADSDFEGCLSTDSTQVTITLYPVQDKPVGGYFSPHDSDTSLVFYDVSNDMVGDSVEFDFEADELTSDTTFHVRSFFSSATGNNYRYKWYFSNSSGNFSPADSIANSDPSGDPRDSIITASDLKVAGITITTSRYFLVTQITDIEPGSGGFQGVQSPATLVRINIYDTPEPPNEYQSNSAADPGDVNKYYCETDDDSVNPLSDDMEGLRVESNDDDMNPRFVWYNSLDSANANDSTYRLVTNLISTGGGLEGDTITPAQLRNDLANLDLENTQYAYNMSSDTVPPGTYTFYVSQIVDRKFSGNATPGGGTYAGDPFVGVESEPLEITIYVRPVPVAPGVVDQTLFMCEDDVIPTFRISAPSASSQYYWFQHTGNAALVDDYSSYLDTVNAPTYTPSAADENIGTDGDGDDANPGTYYFFASVISDIGINNSDFEGCPSLFTADTLRVRPIPEAPVTMSDFTESGDEIYQYCEDDVINLFAIDSTGSVTTNANYNTQASRGGSADSITVFQWYDEDSDPLNANSSGTFDPNGEFNENNLLSEQANNFRFRVTQRTSINSAEGFNGCVSDFKDVILRINGLPTLSFDDISTNDAFCLEEDQITVTASSNGINGTGVFALFDDYSTTGTGLTNNWSGSTNSGTATIDLDAMHLSDDDPLSAKTNKLTVGGETTVRNIYFRFTDVNGCKDSISVNNIEIDPYPAIDFKIDDNEVDTFNTCLNEEDDIFAERTFFLEGFYTESGASIASTGDSDFKVFDDDGELGAGVGITSDVDALAEFSPLDARKSLDATNDTIQRYDPTNTYRITFTHTDLNGCTNEVDAKITVFPLPFFSDDNGVIIANKACASKTVEFAVDLVNLDDGAATFKWFVDNDEILASDELDGDATDDETTVLTDGKFVIGGGPKTIVLQAEDTVTGCVNQVSETKSIGVVPTPRFKWEDITVNNSTVFSFEERALDFRYSEYEDVELTISDNSGAVVNQMLRDRGDFINNNSAMLDDYIVDFASAGSYQAVFKILSTANCDSVITRTFNIVDKIVVPQEGLVHNFDNGTNGWHTDSISVDRFYDGISDERIDEDQESASILRYSTWEHGVPSGRTLNLTNAPFPAGGSAWVTDLDGPYGSKGPENSKAENSWVYSPTFDITAMEKPAMSFYYASHLLNTDGVVVQYTVNDGATWGTLGEFSFDEGNSGVNWYNFLGLPGNPGNIDDPSNINYNPEQFGWTEETNSIGGGGELSQNYYWKLAANKIDEKDTEGNYIIDPANWANIRFRIALGSRPSIKQDANGNNLEGFAFDYFRIFDRQKVVLLETFSSALAENSLEAEDIINDRVQKSGPGTVWVNYFTDLDGTVQRPTDSLFLRNEVDPTARGSFYGVHESPTSVLDGEVIEKDESSDTRADALLGWNQFALNQKELVEPEFDIMLEELSTTSQDEVRVEGQFTSLINIPGTVELSFRFIVIEDFIASKNFGLYSTTDTIRNVMRKILPDPSGFVEKTNQGVKTGDAFNFEINWTLDAVYNVDELRVIAFVQNEETKEIYQVAFIEIDGKANTVTGLRNDLERGDPYELYPNPANTETTVSFYKAWNIDLEWVIYDQLGRIMKEGILDRRQREMTIQTGDLPSGVYFLQLNHEKYKWEPKRLMILHD